MKRPRMLRAVFLDRDGVINPLIYHRDAGIVDSPATVEQFRVSRGVPQAIRRLNDLGLAVVLVSNQPGIAKGKLSAATLKRIERKMHASLAAAGAHFDAVYYCLHHPQARLKRLRKHCRCRKPGIGMLVRASRELGITLSASYMVGDGLTDIEAGNAAGCRTIFVGRWKCEHCQFIRPPGLQPSFTAVDLAQAVRIIESDLARPLPSPSRLQQDAIMRALAQAPCDSTL